jgi:Fe-S cluster assembly scaffold protein SufB
MNTIFKFLHSIMFTLTLQISKLTKAVVLNSFPHGRFCQFAYKENAQTIIVSDLPISNNLLLWNCLVKWAELWWEAHIEGAVCIKFPQSWMKGERHRLRPLSLYFQWAKHEQSVATMFVNGSEWNEESL